MPKFKKGKDELENELVEQVQALRASAKSYDDGNTWEAKRLASTIYILLHDGTGRRTKSLLGQLGKKTGLRLISSVLIQPKVRHGMVVTAVSATSLTMINISGGEATVIPVLDQGHKTEQYKWLPFSKWYNECVFDPISKIDLSRKNIIFTTRSQDGGAHVDSHITDAYYRSFSQMGDPNMRLTRGGFNFGPNLKEGKPLPNGMRAIVRQIAWEADQSLTKIGL